jgi:hypothetical protein
MNYVCICLLPSVDNESLKILNLSRVTIHDDAYISFNAK